MSTSYPVQYDPQLVLNDPAFKVLPNNGTIPVRDPTKNIALCYNQHKEIHIVEKPMPKAGAGQVIVHVRATGICGSDCSFWKKGRIGETMVVRDECGAGHESAGEIISVGPGVEEWKVGDRVAIEAGVPCGSCEFCRIGRYNACPTVVFFSTPPYHGTLTRYHLHPASWLHRLPDHVTFEEGALLEPLAVALAGIERSTLKLGDPLLICGAGPIGIVTLVAARAAGATPIIITDLSESRLAFAKKLVPDVKTLVVERTMTSKVLGAKIREVIGIPGGVNCALECTGVESSVQAAIYSVKFGSTVLVIGVGPDYHNLPFGHMAANEIDLKLQYRYANQYPKAIRLVSSGLIDVKSLVTHRFTLENAVEAMETAYDVSKGCEEGNLDERCTDALVWELMLQAGPVVNVHLPKDRISMSHQGFGFCEFLTEDDADYACKIMNQIKLYGKPIRVNKASSDRKQLDIGANLFVGNLDPNVDERILFDTFMHFGTLVQPAKISRDVTTGASKGYGFISYDSFEAADAAIESMNNQFLANKPVTVGYAFKKDGKGERHGTPAERLLAAQARKNNALPPSGLGTGMLPPPPPVYGMGGQGGGLPGMMPTPPPFLTGANSYGPPGGQGFPPPPPPGFAPQAPMQQQYGVPPPPPPGFQ